MKHSLSTYTLLTVTLILTLANIAAPQVVRDHRTRDRRVTQPEVRDHRDTQPQVRDHRSCKVSLLSPMNNAVLSQRRIGEGQFASSWTFSWTECPGATRYNLYVIGPGATNPLVNTDTLGTSYLYRSTHYGLTQLEGWTWRVRAYVNGEWGRWSDIRTFNVSSSARPVPTPVTNAIFRFRALDRSDKALEVIVDYAFDGKHSDAEPMYRSYMSAVALQPDGTQVPGTHFEGFGPAEPLRVGFGSSRMLINKLNNNPYRSVGIRICINTQDRRGRLLQPLCEYYRHPKYWE
jgi:hypothetical protein